MTPEILVEMLQERSWQEIYPEILQNIIGSQPDIQDDDVRVVFKLNDHYIIMFFEYEKTCCFELLSYENEDVLQSGQFFGPIHAEFIVENFKKQL